MWRRQHEGKERYETWERAARMRDLKQYGDTTGGTWDAYPCRWGARAEWGPAADELHWHIGRKGTWTG